jgi:hypothetical protein
MHTNTPTVWLCPMNIKYSGVSEFLGFHLSIFYYFVPKYFITNLYLSFLSNRWSADHLFVWLQVFYICKLNSLTRLMFGAKKGHLPKKLTMAHLPQLSHRIISCWRNHWWHHWQCLSFSELGLQWQNASCLEIQILFCIFCIRPFLMRLHGRA